MQQQIIELTIRMLPPDGRIEVTGPINQKALCYGLLECAKDAIRDHVAGLVKGTGIVTAHSINGQGEELKRHGG